MAESQRVINGSKTKGSQVLNVTVEGEKNSNIFAGKVMPSEGWTTTDRKILEVTMRSLLRTNSNDARVSNGKKVSTIIYDDTFSNTSVASAFTIIPESELAADADGDGIADGIDSKAISLARSRDKIHHAIFNSNKVNFVLEHGVENRDLGQHKLYEDDPAFREMTNPEDPIEIITTHSSRMYLPISMVDFSSHDALDGVIDPLNTRKNIDRSTIEIPFPLQGVRGSLSNEDIFRNPIEFADGYNLADQSTRPEVDGLEFFGPVELPPVVYPDNRKIKPFTDRSSYLELYFEREQARQGVTVDEDMRAAIINGNNNSSFDESDQREFDLEPARGSDEPGGAAFRGMEK